MEAKPQGPNVLKDCGLPLFFKVADLGEAAVRPPQPRLGESVRLVARSLSDMQKEALVISSRTGIAWRLSSDEGPYLAGYDAAPCPLSFLSTGMVCAFMNELIACAEQRGIKLQDIVLDQDNYYTMKGSARDGSMIGGAKDVHLAAEFGASSLSSDEQCALLTDAVAACSITSLLRNKKTSLFTLSHNGKEIAPAKVQRLSNPAAAEPNESFAAAEPSAGDWDGLIANTGQKTPIGEETTTFAGGSLAESQDRTLHVRVRCKLRGDGMKEITQYLYNPHGSIFRFLSDEAQTGARAPDAASYIAAGIGFCFMTQFGRYSKIMHKPFDSYQIVQDMHFTPGGASGKTGKPGQTDAVETHFHLHSQHDDDLARQALDMSEQTCFLHALCRSELKVRIRTGNPKHASEQHAGDRTKINPSPSTSIPPVGPS